MNVNSIILTKIISLHILALKCESCETHTTFSQCYTFCFYFAYKLFIINDVVTNIDKIL